MTIDPLICCGSSIITTLRIIIICDENRVYGSYFASCMVIIFNKLRQQQVKYDEI